MINHTKTERTMIQFIAHALWISIFAMIMVSVLGWQALIYVLLIAGTTIAILIDRKNKLSKEH